MRYKKKKGSTLLVVVCLCAFLSVLTLSIMLVTTNGFKLRKDENTRIENFYSADSGIEIAKNEIIKVIEKAIEYARDKIEKNPKNKVDEDEKKQIIFKKAFEEYIDLNLEEAIDNTKLEDGSEPKTKIYDRIFNPNNEKNIPVVKVDAIKGKRYQDDKILEENENGSYSKDIKRYRNWEIKSNFKDKDKNEREVKVNYNIVTPNYGKVSDEAIPNLDVFNYILGIDGNLDIKNGASFQGIGDMWVKGRDDESGERKNMHLPTYKPAIKLHGGMQDAEFTWNGDIVTSKDIFIEDTNLQIGEENPGNNLEYNLYADNLLYKGKSDSKKVLNFNGDILLSNDFIFDAKNTNLIVKNYYGLDEIDESVEGNQTNKEREENMEEWGTSSSIIVNSEDFGTESKITIKNDIYVLGTAYLQLKGEPYKTGESIAINKFAEPYTNRNIKDKDKYLYTYRNPLHIIDEQWDPLDGKYKKMTILEKAKIVKDYLGENPEDKIFKGLIIGEENLEDKKNNIVSSGILYNSGKVIPINSNYNKEFVDSKREKFIEEAYNMGAKLPIKVDGEVFEKRDEIKKATVDMSFNWKFIRDNMMREEILRKKDGTEIFERVDSFPKDDNVPKDIAIFQSKMELEEIFKDISTKDEEEKKNVNDFFKGKINIIFNSSERRGEGSPTNPKKLYFSDKYDYIKDIGNEKFNIPVKYINNTQDLTIVISDGEINIINPITKLGGKEIQVRGAFYSSENLNISSEAGVTFGNISVPGFSQINDIFKKLFGEVLDGVVAGGAIDQTKGDYVINPSDLLEQKDWNLIK